MYNLLKQHVHCLHSLLVSWACIMWKYYIILSFIRAMVWNISFINFYGGNFSFYQVFIFLLRLKTHLYKQCLYVGLRWYSWTVLWLERTFQGSLFFHVSSMYSADIAIYGKMLFKCESYCIVLCHLLYLRYSISVIYWSILQLVVICYSCNNIMIFTDLSTGTCDNLSKFML